MALPPLFRSQGPEANKALRLLLFLRNNRAPWPSRPVLGLQRKKNRKPVRDMCPSTAFHFGDPGVRYLFWLVSVVVIIVLSTFVAVNLDSVTVDFFPLPRYPVPAALLVVGPLFLGCLLGAFLVWIQALRHKSVISNQRHRIAALEEEVAGLEKQLAATQAALERASTEMRQGRTKTVSSRLPGLTLPGPRPAGRTGRLLAGVIGRR